MEIICRKSINDFDENQVINEIKTVEDLNKITYEALQIVSKYRAGEQKKFNDFVIKLLPLCRDKKIASKDGEVFSQDDIKGFYARMDNRTLYEFFQNMQRSVDAEKEAALEYKHYLKKRGYEIKVCERVNTKDTGKPTFRRTDFNYLDYKIIVRKIGVKEWATLDIDFKNYHYELPHFIKTNDLKRAAKQKGYVKIVIRSRGEFFIYNIGAIKFALNKINNGYSACSYIGDKFKKGKNGIWVGDKLDKDRNVILFEEFKKNNCEVLRNTI